MNQEIYSIKNLPDKLELDGDYNITQAALFLGTLAEGPLTLKNYNAGNDTGKTVEFLVSVGVDVEKYESAIVINYAEFGPDENGRYYKIKGSVLSLSLAIGLMVGKNVECTIEYEGEINPDAVDNLVMMLNREGLDISHFDPAHCSEDSSCRGVIVIRQNSPAPIQIRLKSALPYQKVCLLMYGLSSGCSIIVEEEYKTDDWLEATANFLNGDIKIRDAKLEWRQDPHDPRKRKKIADLDFSRLITLGPSKTLSGGELIVPSDVNETSALLTWAVLKNKEINLRSVYMNRSLDKYLQYLKTCGSDHQTSNRDHITGWSLADINLKGAKPKSRKLADNVSRSIAEFYPLVAVMAAISDGTTLMRGLSEMDIWFDQPFAETIDNLGRCGVKGGVLEDGFVIEAINELNGDDFGPFANRAAALAFYILARCGKGRSTVDKFEIIAENYPKLISNFKDEILKPVIVYGDSQ